MNKLTATLLAVAAVCALAVPAGAAAKPVKYVGATNAGHKVAFKLFNNFYSCLGEATFTAKPA